MGPRGRTYGLHQDVVLAEEQRGSGVLVQGLHVVPRPHEGPVVYAAARLPLLDLRRTTTQHNTQDNAAKTHWEDTGKPPSSA